MTTLRIHYANYDLRQQWDRAIAQAVSQRFSTATARVRVWSCGICGGQNVTEKSFLWVLRFPLPILIPPTVPQSSHLSSGAGTISQLVADVPTGLSFTPPQETKKKTTIIVISYGLMTCKFDNFSLFQSSKFSPCLNDFGECVEIYPQHALIFRYTGIPFL
jgi:hypothetical protein